MGGAQAEGRVTPQLCDCVEVPHHPITRARRAGSSHTQIWFRGRKAPRWMCALPLTTLGQ